MAPATRSRRRGGVKSALAARAFLTPLVGAGSGDCRGDGFPSPFPISEGPAMKRFHDDFAAALVSATLCLAAASLFVVVFGGAV